MADVQQKYFDAVAAELMGKTIKAGLWARAIAETGSDDGSAKAIYIRLRAEELCEEDAKRRLAIPPAPSPVSKAQKALQTLWEKKTEPNSSKGERDAKPPKRYSYEEFVSLHAPLAEFTPKQRMAMYEKWRRGEVRRMQIRKDLGHREDK
jgi:hypothetical protein